ncbi:MAG: hypothetical protein ACLFQB_15045 [Chitinispirillaceae bacterium]
MIKQIRIWAMLGCLVLAGTVYGNINLNALQSRGVREAVWCPVKIDTLLLSSEVSGGVAKSSMTLVATPELPEGTALEVVYDSLEISMSMNGLGDFAMQELYLWVNGEPQRGYIQDRWIAENQYSDIVGRRLDPAILSTWGGGNYNLRIFPARTGKSRKIKIDFQHSFEDSLNQIMAKFPFDYNKTQSIGYTEVSLKALDGKDYQFSMEGLGEGSFRKGRDLVFRSKKVFELGEGIISAADPSGRSVYAWSGKDKIDGESVLGFKYQINEETVDLEPESEVRTIILDAQNEFWSHYDYYQKLKQARNHPDSYYSYVDQDDKVNILSRIKKMAVLALRRYVNENQKFNIVTESTGPLFSSPVRPTKRNLKKAYDAIREFEVSETSQTVSKMKSAVKNNANGIIILLSDAYEPYDFYDEDFNITESGNDFLEMIDSVKSVVTTSESALFTVTDAYQLNNVAYQSGGHRLTGLRHIYQYTGTADSVLPPLFSYNRGITNIEVKAGPQFSDVVHTIENENHYSWLSYHYPVYNSDILLNVSAKSVEGTLPKLGTFTVNGMLNGRSFSKEISVESDEINAHSDSNVLWALRKASSQNYHSHTEHRDTIKRIGMDYHIVTTRTSLLALEPDMELWPDTTGTAQQETDRAFLVSSSSKISSDEFSGIESEIDSVSLEDLINGVSVDVTRKDKVSEIRSAEIGIKALTGGIELSLPSSLNGKKLELKLFDLTGRLVASRSMSGTETSGRVLWKLSSANRLVSNRYYVLRVRGESYEKTQRVLIVK